MNDVRAETDGKVWALLDPFQLKDDHFRFAGVTFWPVSCEPILDVRKSIFIAYVKLSNVFWALLDRTTGYRLRT